MGLARARELMEKWKLQDAYQEVDMFLLQDKLPQKTRIEAEFLKIDLLDRMGVHENALTLAQKVYEEIK